MFERVCVRLGFGAAGPEMLGRYALRDWIGRGGMGEVYRAYDTELEREVAVKLITPRPGIEPLLLRRRLRREAQLLAQLDHPNLVRVYDSGCHEGCAFLVMEFVDGATLRQLQAAATLTSAQLLRHYVEAAHGLLAAHARGVIHRDFKPDNVFVGADGRARVGDFGLAHVFGKAAATPTNAAEHDDKLSQAGVGTLGYMAPEQLRGDPLDARADQYAFCVSVWEALDGSRPFAAPNARSMLEAMAGSPRGGERIDARLRRALKVGLALQPANRHESLTQLVAAIDEVIERPLRRRQHASKWLFALAAVGGIVGGAIGYRAANPDCPLADDVERLQGETDWAKFEHRIARSFQTRVAQMKREAERACLRRDLAARQHVESLVHSFRSLLAHEHWRDHLARFEADFASRASVPMTPLGYGFLTQELQPLEDAWVLEELVAKCDEIEGIPWPEVDRAGLRLPCARARAIRGDWEGAIADFKQARNDAEFVGDRTRRLQATLGAATITLTRLQQYDAGAELLQQADDLLRALDVPALDPRRAEFDRLIALLLRETGKLDEARDLLRRVVARQLPVGPTGGRVYALISLANLHETRDEPNAAEAAHRAAMYLDPDDPEAAFNFARFLVNTKRDDTQARKLLVRVLSLPDHDLQLIATAALLNLELESGDADLVAKLRKRLTAMLLDEEVPRTPEQAVESWMVVALAHACFSDTGPGYWQARNHVPEGLIDDLDAEIDRCKQPTTGKDP